MASAAIDAATPREWSQNPSQHPSPMTPRKRHATQTASNDEEPFDLAASVGQSIASLAGSLFADHVRNRQMMPAWLAHPLPPIDVVAPQRRALAQSATTWSEHTRKRADKRRFNMQRAMSKRRGGLDVAMGRHRQRILDNLVPAATAAAGRRVPRASSALRSTVAAMRRSSEQAVQRRPVATATTPTTRHHVAGTTLGASVDSFALIVRALLLERIDFTIVAGAGDDCSLHIFPFGDARLAQFNVPSSLLNVVELRAIEYLAMSTAQWVDADRYRDDDVGECLRASYMGNDAFDVALDRIRLVEALRETMLYGGGDRLEVRHVVEAALVSAASHRDVMAAGYHDSLMRMSYATRMAPVPMSTSPLDYRNAFTVAAARERSHRLHIRSIDARVYHAMLKEQLVGDAAAHRSARAAAFGDDSAAVDVNTHQSCQDDAQ